MLKAHFRAPSGLRAGQEGCFRAVEGSGDDSQDENVRSLSSGAPFLWRLRLAGVRLACGPHTCLPGPRQPL